MIDLLSSIEQAQTLGAFKAFCDKNCSSANKQRLRNILNRAVNKNNCLTALFKNEINTDLTPDQAEYMLTLITSFLNKSSVRKSISKETKQHLLEAQNYRCNICGKQIDSHAHADHIIPFKYVGDELNEDNLQMLCSTCNESKKASFDYQIRHLLKLL